jgi:hypothetical protein
LSFPGDVIWITAHLPCEIDKGVSGGCIHMTMSETQIMLAILLVLAIASTVLTFQ